MENHGSSMDTTNESEFSPRIIQNIFKKLDFLSFSPTETDIIERIEEILCGNQERLSHQK